MVFHKAAASSGGGYELDIVQATKTIQLAPAPAEQLQ